ncbi:MAG: DUF4962 domain-containing protein [Planctomycetota bacterium]
MLEPASTLAFVWRVTGREEFGELAKRLLLECARWDPEGATGYRYNDEAGMPYAYWFARTYTLVRPLLDDEERAACRDVMRVRGREMYAHLAPSHLWKPYSSHSNRAWHFLGEVGIAFLGEIEEADDWVWFAANVFACVYPVWSDDDGGWHEGNAYWNSYLQRFTWWADVQRAALGLDAYALPFFARAGDFALYLMPPGTRGGGFGDLCGRRTSAQNRELVSVLAAQARNPQWAWYVERNGGYDDGGGWIGFLRSGGAPLEPRAPTDLPTSRLFEGTGVAVLQSTLIDASENVEVVFKSSPFGTQSHGYDAQNAFLLYAFGERLLIRSGRRDSYGSEHHRGWMWETRSENSITVDGRGQRPHTAKAPGRITGFHTEPGLHWVEGEAGRAYGGDVTAFRRGILFVEPDLVVVFDRVEAEGAERLDWLLHAEEPFAIDGARADLEVGRAACSVEWFAPSGLEVTQTDRFDPPPRERVKLVEHHLTAEIATTGDATTVVTVLRPRRADDPVAPPAVLERGDGVLRLRATVAGRDVVVDASDPDLLRVTVAGRDERTIERSRVERR